MPGDNYTTLLPCWVKTWWTRDDLCSGVLPCFLTQSFNQGLRYGVHSHEKCDISCTQTALTVCYGDWYMACISSISMCCFRTHIYTLKSLLWVFPCCCRVFPFLIYIQNMCYMARNNNWQWYAALLLSQPGHLFLRFPHKSSCSFDYLFREIQFWFSSNSQSPAWNSGLPMGLNHCCWYYCYQECTQHC